MATRTKKKAPRRPSPKKEDDLVPVIPTRQHIFITKKQEQFLQEYVKDYKGKEAAIRSGYQRKLANSISNKLLSMPHIQKRLDEIEEDVRLRNNVEVDYFITNLKGINEEKDNKGKYTTRNSDRISALALLAKITGHLKEKPTDNKQVVILQQKGLMDQIEVSLPDID